MLLDNDIYLRGTLYFANEPDWDLTAWYLSRIVRNSRGMVLTPEHAECTQDGEFSILFRSSGKLQPGPRCNSRHNGDDNHDESNQNRRIEEYIEDFSNNLSEYLGCEAEIDVIDPRYCDRKDLDWIIEREKEPDFLRYRMGKIQGEDLEPERPCGKSNSEDPLAELDAMIGLEPVKDQVHEIVKLVEKSGKEKLPCLHMVFTGNPGTGKTTVARLIGRIFDQMGVTSGKGVFKEVGREDLVGRYVGHTAPTTKKAINQAKGGVLFIDEAYTLGIYSDDINKGFHDYGEEALATLVREMENNRDDFICIMAGYREPMEKMISVNPGLRDRIGFYVDFPDYGANELMEIFDSFASADGMTLDDDSRIQLSRAFEDIVAAKGDNFSNGRLVRKIFERVRMKHAVTCEQIEDAVSAETMRAVLAEQDIAAMKDNTKQTVSIGFASAIY